MATGEVFRAVGILALRDILQFPLWWYSRGIFYFLHKLTLSARRQSAYFAVGLWVKNLFVPMYGQYDWQGRIISFFIRLAQIIFRSLGLGIWLMILVFCGAAYLALPLVFLFFFLLHFPLFL